MNKTRVWGSGSSPFFHAEDFLPTYPRICEDAVCDVTVIGGGLSGLLCAYGLIRAGLSVVVLTANTVGDGASRFSTGTVCGDGGGDLLRLRELLGTENCVSWYRYASGATARLEQIVREIGSRCDFRLRDVFYYTASRREVGLLREEYLMRHHLGSACRWLEEGECREAFSFPVAAGILQQGGCEMNAVRLCRDLADWITVHGASVYEGSRVDEIEAPKRNEYRCRVGEVSVKSRFVVDARGGDAVYKRPQLGRRATVFTVVTRPVDEFRGWPDRCLIKRHDRFGFLRTAPDGRIVFSGGVSTVLSPDGRLGALRADGLCRIKFRALESELREMFVAIPRLKTEDSFTQGIVVPRKGLPFVGRDDGWEGLYYLYAFGECGIAGAVFGAHRIRCMITDRTQNAPPFLAV